jgi:hypothetical protein
VRYVINVRRAPVASCIAPASVPHVGRALERNRHIRHVRFRVSAAAAAVHGTGADIDEVKLAHVVQEMVHLSPRGIREMLHMNRPIYVPTSSYGHFGRTPDEEKGTFTWERTDLAAALKSAFNR